MLLRRPMLCRNGRISRHNRLQVYVAPCDPVSWHARKSLCMYSTISSLSQSEKAKLFLKKYCWVVIISGLMFYQQWNESCTPMRCIFSLQNLDHTVSWFGVVHFSSTHLLKYCLLCFWRYGHWCTGAFSGSADSITWQATWVANNVEYTAVTLYDVMTFQHARKI